jgi:hypothetical protein
VATQRVVRLSFRQQGFDLLSGGLYDVRREYGHGLRYFSFRKLGELSR